MRQKNKVRCNQLATACASPVAVSSGIEGPTATPATTPATIAPRTPKTSAATITGTYITCTAEYFTPPRDPDEPPTRPTRDHDRRHRRPSAADAMDP